MLHCLCREVDLGPFKHKIDDGLELRKAAFECMDVLLERCRDQINMGDFITHLEKGLQVSAVAAGQRPVSRSSSSVPCCSSMSGLLAAGAEAQLRILLEA